MLDTRAELSPNRSLVSQERGAKREVQAVYKRRDYPERKARGACRSPLSSSGGVFRAKRAT